MELRTYWSVIWRRIWIIAIIVGVVALYVGYQYYHLRKTPGALKTYQSQVVVQIGLETNSRTTTHNNYSDYVSVSESIADEYATGPVLTSPEFDKQVSDQIATDMNQIKRRYGSNPDLGNWQNTGAIAAALNGGANRFHSLVTVTATWDTPAGAWAIANAVGEVSAVHISQYLDYIVVKSATATPIPSSAGTTTVILPSVAAKVVSNATNPATIAGPSANKINLLLALLFVALVIGIALAFLIDYLDDRLRNKDSVVQLLQLPVYGEIPRAPSLGNENARRKSVA